MNIPYVFRKCSECGEWLVANKYNFHKNKNRKCGLDNRCKECKKERGKQWYKDNKEHSNKLSKKWHENNKEYHNKLSKQWYENNKEYSKEYAKQYYEINKEYKREYVKQYREENPEKEFNRCNRRRSKLENQGRGITREQYKECNSWFDWKCAYSGEKLQKNKSTYGRTLDHIIALDNGGLNEPWNIVPMRKGYNSCKWKRTDSITWYLEQEYFDIERLNKIVEWQIYAFNKWATENDELILITDLLED